MDSLPKQLHKRSGNFPSTISNITNNQQTSEIDAESKLNEPTTDNKNNQEQPPAVPKTVEAFIIGSVKDFNAECAVSVSSPYIYVVCW